MYALGDSPNVTSAKSVDCASLAATPSGFIPGEMQAPSLMPFLVSFANAGDASWAPSELEDGWLADDVVTLDDDLSSSPDNFVLDEDSGLCISLEELSF